MGDENINPLDELKRLDFEIELATDLAELKPIYFRLNDIARSNLDNFDVQFAVSETRQHLMTHGTALKQGGPAPTTKSMPAFPPPSSPVAPVDTATFTTPEQSIPPSTTPFPATPPPATPPSTPKVVLPPAPPPPPLGTAPMRPASEAPKPPARPPAPQGSGPNWKIAALLVLLAGLVIAIGVTVVVVRQLHKRKATVANLVRAVPVDLATSPPGASVRVIPANAAAGGNNEAACTSNCRLSLAPGDYQVTASLDGFEPAAGNVHVADGKSAQLSLPLQPQAQSVRILTDLDQGKVVLDDQPPADLQEGQLTLEKVPPGSHTLKITGKNGEASFSFEIADAGLPALAGPVMARNLMAVLVSSFGKTARVVTNAGPLKLAVNGQPQADAGPAGADVTNFQPGVDQIVVGDGRDQRNMSEMFGAAPMITAFLKSDVNAGTLIVSTGQDDVRVFLNDKEYRRRTQKGQLRIQTLGKVTVRVAKNGFQDEPAQTAEVKKGEDVRLQFALKPQPQFGSLQIRGGLAGAEVLVDQKTVGTVGADGTFSFNTVQPGEHAIEIRRAQFAPKRLQRAFQAGQAITLTGADAVLVAANGTVHVTSVPPGATFTYRRADETEPHEVHGNQIDVPPGSYVITAASPGYVEGSTRVQLAGGDNQGLEFRMARERPAAPPPAPVVPHGMADFEDPAAWKKEGDVWVHKGAAFLHFKLSDEGVFTFTVQLLKGGSIFRPGKIRWCVQYVDSKNYLLSEMDPKLFWTGVIEKGTRLERKKVQHNLPNPKSFTIQITVTPDELVQKVQVGGEWTVLDSFTEPGRDFTKGKFGFLIQGNDEIAISDFRFVAK